MKHEWHPCSSTSKFWAVVCNELIRNINSIHPMIVVIDNYWDEDIPSVLIPPHMGNIVLVYWIYSWSSSVCLHLFSFTPCMNSRYHLHYIVIDPPKDFVIVFIVQQITRIKSIIIHSFKFFWWPVCPKK